MNDWILETLCKSCGDCLDLPKDCVMVHNQATAIREEMMKRLPKEKKILKTDKITADMRRYPTGYNDCLADVKEALQ